MQRVICTGGFALEVPPDEAISFFTPEGERSWAPGWDPQYPAHVPSDDPGTVFITTAHGTTSTWIITTRSEGRISYARMQEGQTAGTIAVKCRQHNEPGTTFVEVVYDLTALSVEVQHHLEEFRDGYRAYINSWRDEIVASQ